MCKPRIYVRLRGYRGPRPLSHVVRHFGDVYIYAYCGRQLWRIERPLLTITDNTEGMKLCQACQRALAAPEAQDEAAGQSALPAVGQ